MASNWLKLNDSKTDFIIFGAKRNLSSVDTDSIMVGDAAINPSDSVKSIGATLDSSLSLKKHVNLTCKTAWYHLHQISKIKQYLTEDQLKAVIHSYVICRLDTNNSLLIGLPKTSLSHLQMVQNACARLIFSLKKRDHITPSLRILHWLPIEKRILFKVLLLVYKAINQKGPLYLKQLLVPYVPGHALRSADSHLLCVPECHYASTRCRAFGIAGPSEWNKLPKDIKTSSSVDSFKRALKTHLFRQAYS